MKLPPALERVVRELSELPSIGPRQAIRLAVFLVGRGVDRVRALAQAIDGLRAVKACSDCFFVHENDSALCDICKNPSRRRGVIMIVEKETDVLSVENTGKYAGRYCVIGSISKTGLLENSQKLRLQFLKRFIEKELEGKAEEIILGFNLTTIGDFHASLLAKDLRPLAKKITRLGRGLPTGGEIEFADDETLGGALEHRG